MPDAQHLFLFIAAGLLLNLTPGPDVLYIVNSALRHGAKAGVVAALGVFAGCFVHVTAAAIGVSALLAASVTAFGVLKWVGAAYLVWVGVRLLVARTAGFHAGRGEPAGEPRIAAERGGGACQGSSHGSPLTGEGRVAYGAILRGGFLTNVLNPKVAIFFLAFVPQFIAPGAPHKALAFLALGTVFNANALAVHAGWALAAAWLAARGAVQRALRWLDRAAGVLFIGFGLRLALAEAPTR